MSSWNRTKTLLSVFAAALVVAPAAGAVSWASPVTVSGTDNANLGPRVGTDANGDVLVAWLQTASTTLGSQCPCKVRAAYRPAGGSFGAPVDVSPSITTSDGAQQIYLAMASNGDAVVAWNDADNGLPYAAIRPAGASFQAPVQLASQVGQNEFGVAVDAVQMDAAGDALALIGNDQAYTGPSAISGDQVINTQLVRRPAGGAFDTSHPQTFGDGTHNYFARALGMSPAGKAVVTMRVDAVDESSPSGPVSNAVEVSTSAAPGAAFASTPTTIQSISDHPQSGMTVYPVLDTGSSTFPMAAIDDSGDYAVTYDDSIANGSDTAKVSLNGTGGTAIGTAAIGNGAGPVVIAPSGQAVAFANSGGTELESARSAGGAFGASAPVGNGITYASSIVNASNEPSANGQVLLSFDAAGTSGMDDAASIGSPAGAFPGPTTIASNDDNFSFGTQGAIDASGDAAVTWIGGTTGYQVQVAIASSGSSHGGGTHTLTVARSGSGSGTVSSSPAGISCGSTCAHAFNSGTQVTLHASAASGSKFAGWSGGGCSGAGSCTVTLSGDQTVTATFNKSGGPSGHVANTVITKKKINKHKRSATFSFKATGAAARGFQCALLKAPKKGHKARSPHFTGCTSPKSYKHLARGKYVFEVRAVNSAGPDRTPATAKFTL